MGKVEIVKGPGSLMYGSDGIAGVLNFISPKVPSEGKIENQFTTNYQSNNNLIANSFSNSASSALTEQYFLANQAIDGGILIVIQDSLTILYEHVICNSYIIAVKQRKGA